MTWDGSLGFGAPEWKDDSKLIFGGLKGITTLDYRANREESWLDDKMRDKINQVCQLDGDNRYLLRNEKCMWVGEW